MISGGNLTKNIREPLEKTRSNITTFVKTLKMETDVAKQKVLSKFFKLRKKYQIQTVTYNKMIHKEGQTKPNKEYSKIIKEVNSQDTL